MTSRSIGRARFDDAVRASVALVGVRDVARITLAEVAAAQVPAQG
jgi:hypothetical protein